MSYLLRAKGLEFLFKWMCAAAVLIPIGIFVFIFGTSLLKGYERLSWGFLTEPMAYGGQAGGILYQIVGTGILIGAAAILVTPFSWGLAIVASQSKSPAIKHYLRVILHILNATPSILFGILGFIFFIRIFGWDKSWLSGGIILALMILPTVTISLINRIETIPQSYLETAWSLGLNRDQLIKSTIIPYSYGGLFTGLVMGLARAAGETAPIMFIAAVFSGAGLPSGVTDSPVLALPYHIFNLSQDVYFETAISGAWATASILLMMILVLSIAVLPFRMKFHEEAKH